jgi:hypothetical protein
MKPSTFPLAVLLIALATTSTLAHHSVTAEFDSQRPITISGIVNNVDWMNPHTYVFVDVKDSVGTTRTWACELESPNVLARKGLTRESLKVGMNVRVIGTRAKDGSFKIHTDSLAADNSVLLPR